MIEKVIVNDKLEKFSEYWSPKIVGELNGQHVKLVKFKGEFTWHKHDAEDEMFYVLKGKLEMQFRDRKIFINENEFLIVPRGIEHRPVAEDEVAVMLFEPASTLNTGDQENDFTRYDLEKL
ncbi:MAG: cupin domain-containing protein [Ferruginibacter sp.]